jgi:hypothetical protein
MRRAFRAIAVSAGAAVLVLSGAGVASANGTTGSGTSYGRYTCSGGDIASGHYARITVTGACSVAADAVIKVAGNVRVAGGAVLDAQSAPSSIVVGGDVIAGAGSLLGLGCQPPDYVGNSAHACTVEPDGHSTITVKGSVTAINADTVLLNGVTVRKNVTLTGGGGDIPWSIKNNRIHGNLTVTGQTAEWLGVLFNWIGGNATLLNITLHDVDPGAPGVYVVRNTIRRNLSCFGLDPGVSGGFIPGEVNVVGRHAIGQCASLV